MEIVQCEHNCDNYDDEVGCILVHYGFFPLQTDRCEAYTVDSVDGNANKPREKTNEQT